MAVYFGKEKKEI